MGKAKRVKVIVYIEIFLFAFEVLCLDGLVIFASAVEDAIIKNIEETDPKDEEGKAQLKLILRMMFAYVFVIVGIVMLCGLILLIVFYKGYAERSTCELNVWFYLTTIGTAVAFMFTLMTLLNYPEQFVFQIYNILLLFYRCIALVIVMSYIIELNSRPPLHLQCVHYTA